MDYKRLNGATPAATQVLHNRLVMRDIKKLQARNRFNMDEIGRMEGMGENDLVLGEAIRKAISLKGAFKRDWISIIVCVNADGRALPPLLVIFSGKNVQQQWFNEAQGRLRGWYFKTSPNGWTNTDIRLKWLTEVLIPHIKPARATEWRLLILHGHNSHTSKEFMITCLVNRIWVIYLPAYSSQALQPLDVGVLSFFKRRFRFWFRERCWGRASEGTDKANFLWALERIWEVMGRTKFTILSFRTSGL